MSLKPREPDMLFRQARVEYPARHKNPAFMAIAFLILVGSGYILFHSSSIFITPELNVYGPEDGARISGGTVEIYGATEPKTRVTINGFEVLSDDTGSFTALLPLEPGFQVLDVRVKNRVGMEAKVVRHIVVE